jgi:hypothetical protein
MKREERKKKLGEMLVDQTANQTAKPLRKGQKKSPVLKQ